MSNIKSFADIKKEQEKDDKEQEYYAGGNDSRGGGSGQATIGPPKGIPYIYEHYCIQLSNALIQLEVIFLILLCPKLMKVHKIDHLKVKKV